MKDNNKALISQAKRNFPWCLLLGVLVIFPSFFDEATNKWFVYYGGLIGSVLAVGVALFVVNTEFVNSRKLAKEDYTRALMIEKRRCLLEDNATLTYCANMLAQEVAYLGSVIRNADPTKTGLAEYDFDSPDTLAGKLSDQLTSRFDFIANKKPIGIFPDIEDIRNVRVLNNLDLQMEIINQMVFLRTLRQMFYSTSPGAPETRFHTQA